MALKPVKVALIGSGNISYTYLNNLVNTFYITDMVGCSDLIPEKSKARAELFGIRQMTNEEILSDPEIEIVVNTTQIAAHTEVSRMILNAGKNAYSEKMMGCTFEEAKETVELARSKGLFFGAAPDTYMGAAFQTARKLIDDGWIGQPIMCQAICIRPSMMSTMPMAFSRPGFGIQGTSMPFDMGGYYINAIVNLLGPVARVSGYCRYYTDRKYTNPRHPDYNMPIKAMESPSMLLGALEFKNGCYGNLVLMGEGFDREIPRIEIFGTEGNLIVPDPNYFSKDLFMLRKGSTEPVKVPFTHGMCDTDFNVPPLSGKREPCHNSRRGAAVADMAYAIRRGRKPRSSDELALHAVEIVTGIQKSCADNKVYQMTTCPEQPKPLAPGFYDGMPGRPSDMEAALDQ